MLKAVKHVADSEVNGSVYSYSLDSHLYAAALLLLAEFKYKNIEERQAAL